MERARRLGFGMIALLGAAVAPIAATAQEPDCFDAVISAKVVRQIPTPIPDCGDDCIVMQWPWIIDLDARRVHQGDLKRGPVAVLAVQHNRYQEGATVRLWLRRNSLGVFNAYRSETGKAMRRCRAGAPPADAFVTGVTLDELRRQGEAWYGKRSAEER